MALIKIILNERYQKLFFFQFGFHQMINNPTHISGTFSSCIDLTFTCQPNLVVESSINLSSHPNCHHQIIFGKFNLKCTIHHSTISKFGITRKRILNLIDEQQIYLIGKKLLKILLQMRKLLPLTKLFSIFFNFFPYETLLVDDKDPPWLTNKIKNPINKKTPQFLSIIVKIAIIYKYQTNQNLYKIF